MEEKKGYSGVCLFSKVRPSKRYQAWGRNASMPREGPGAHFDDMVLFNVYFPNGKALQSA